MHSKLTDRCRIVFIGSAVLAQLCAYGVLLSDDHVQQTVMPIDKEAEEWIRKSLKEQLAKQKEHIEWARNTIQDNSSKPVSPRRCSTGVTREEKDPTIYVFTSFAIPESVWLQLSQEMSRVGGVFVLRGIPNNSFVELAKRILHLKQQGVEVSIQIGPTLFEKYQINQVPAFVVNRGQIFDKLSGCVSLSFALQRFAESGDSKTTLINGGL